MVSHASAICLFINIVRCFARFGRPSLHGGGSAANGSCSAARCGSRFLYFIVMLCVTEPASTTERPFWPEPWALQAFSVELTRLLYLHIMQPAMQFQTRSRPSPFATRPPPSASRYPTACPGISKGLRSERRLPTCRRTRARKGLATCMRRR